MVWRVIVALYFWYLLIASNIIHGFGTNIYLTIWTLNFCTAYMSVSLYCSYLHLRSMNDSSRIDKCVQYCRYAQILQIVACTLSMNVVIVFWGLWAKWIDIGDPLALTIQTHGVSAAFTIFDFYMCYSIISFKKSWYYPIVVGILYGIWSFSYTLITDTSLYPILDWKEEPVASVIAVMIVMLMCLIVQATLCWTKSKFVNWLKSKISSEESPKDVVELNQTESDQYVAKSSSPESSQQSEAP